VELTPRHPAPSTSNTAAQPIPQPDVQIAMEPAQAPAASETVLQPQLLPKPQPKAKPQTKAELSARVKPPADGRSSAAGAHTPGRTAAPVSLPSPDSADAVVALPTVISMAELPPSVRQELPALKISVHAYSSNPSARLVGIDYRILHEGDNVVPGLKLEQITPEGMIFDYKGYRFSHGVK
jgi:general secretion pathway protein B